MDQIEVEDSHRTGSMAEAGPQNVLRRMVRAIDASVRKPGDVRMLAAIKYAHESQLRKLLEMGVTLWGANTAQDLEEKRALFGDDVEWHFIGHLQRNKAAKTITMAKMIHSVDSMRLAEEIQHRAQLAGKIQEILIEVKLSGEMSKYGISKGELQAFLHEAGGFANLRIKGLMTMPPYGSAEDSRLYFRELRNARDEAQKALGLDLPELSMGTSHDFEVAIEEGATIIRVGRSLFEGL